MLQSGTADIQSAVLILYTPYMRFLIGLATLSLSYCLQAETWNRLGIEFNSPSDLYSKNEHLFMKTSYEIADHLTTLLNDNIPQDIKLFLRLEEAAVVFDQTNATDALFIAPGNYKGYREEELRNKSVIVINPAIIQQRLFLRLVSHEFFHLIHHELNPKELDWIKEGLAQYFEYIVHNSINYTNVETALKKSTFPLESEFDPKSVSFEKYGNSFLFIHHLLTHCGVKEDIWKIAFSTRTVGRDTINKYLTYKKSAIENCSNAETIMTSYSLAKMINEPTGKMDPSTIAWDVDTVMPSSMSVANSLSALDPKTLKTFFEKLPSFLGLKFPASEKSFMDGKAFTIMKTDSIRLYHLNGGYPPKLQEMKKIEDLNVKTTGDLILLKTR